MMTHCDLCGTEIKDGECSCGTWHTEVPGYARPMKLALEEFHDMKRFTLTGDAPHLGCAVVFFRGDYTDTKKVGRFIHEMKGRPYYDE